MMTVLTVIRSIVTMGTVASRVNAVLEAELVVRQTHRIIVRLCGAVTSTAPMQRQPVVMNGVFVAAESKKAVQRRFVGKTR